MRPASARANCVFAGRRRAPSPHQEYTPAEYARRARLARLSDTELEREEDLFQAFAAAFGAALRTPPVILTWMCTNPHCGEWTCDGAAATGCCNACGTPRP